MFVFLPGVQRWACESRGPGEGCRTGRRSSCQGRRSSGRVQPQSQRSALASAPARPTHSPDPLASPQLLSAKDKRAQGTRPRRMIIYIISYQILDVTVSLWKSHAHHALHLGDGKATFWVWQHIVEYRKVIGLKRTSTTVEPLQFYFQRDGVV